MTHSCPICPRPKHLRFNNGGKNKGLQTLNQDCKDKNGTAHMTQPHLIDQMSRLAIQWTHKDKSMPAKTTKALEWHGDLVDHNESICCQAWSERSIIWKRHTKWHFPHHTSMHWIYQLPQGTKVKQTTAIECLGKCLLGPHGKGLTMKPNKKWNCRRFMWTQISVETGIPKNLWTRHSSLMPMHMRPCAWDVPLHGNPKCNGKLPCHKQKVSAPDCHMLHKRQFL